MTDLLNLRWKFFPPFFSSIFGTLMRPRPINIRHSCLKKKNRHCFFFFFSQKIVTVYVGPKKGSHQNRKPQFILYSWGEANMVIVIGQLPQKEKRKRKGQY